MLLHLAAVARPESGVAAAGQPVHAAGAGGAAAANPALVARRRRIQLRRQQQQPLLQRPAGGSAVAADPRVSASLGRGEAQAQPEAVPSPEDGTPPTVDAGAAAGVDGPAATQGPTGLLGGQQAATGGGCEGLTCLATAALSPHHL